MKNLLKPLLIILGGIPTLFAEDLLKIAPKIATYVFGRKSY